MIIIVVSLFLSFFGLLAKSMFPFWQVVLLLLLLALLITYLLDKKLGHRIYVVQEQGAEIDFEQVFDKSSSEKEKTIVEEQKNDDKYAKDIVEEPVPVSEDFLPALDMVELRLDSEQQHDFAEEKLPVFEDGQSARDSGADHIEIDEEITFLENRLRWLEQSSETLADHDKETDDITSDLSEIETWLLEEEKGESVHEEAVADGVLERANSNNMNISESETLIKEPSILMDDDFIPELKFEDDATDIAVDKHGEDRSDKS